MPTPDIDLAKQVLAHITAQPGSWNQSMWARRTECGTAFCFAGHAVAIAYPGAVFDFGDDVLFGDEVDDAYHVTLPGESEPRGVRDVAMERLGLNEGEANELFDSYNDLEDLAVTIENIAFAHAIVGGAS